MKYLILILLYAMFTLLYQTNKYKIVAILTNKSDIISFNECFEIIASDEILKYLSKYIKIRCNRAYPKNKLLTFESEILKITLAGKIAIDDLKKHLPTVFDNNYIKRMNSMEFMETNKEIIIETAGNIIGKENSKKLVDNLLNK